MGIAECPPWGETGTCSCGGYGSVASRITAVVRHNNLYVRVFLDLGMNLDLVLDD